MGSVNYSTFRCDDFDWFHEPRTGGDIRGDQAAEAIRHCRHRYRFDGINGAGNLRRTAAEIDYGAIVFDCDTRANRNLALADAIVVERVLCVVGSIRYLNDCPSHHA